MSCDYPEPLGPDARPNCGGVRWAALASEWAVLMVRASYNQLWEVLSELEVAVCS